MLSQSNAQSSDTMAAQFEEIDALLKYFPESTTAGGYVRWLSETVKANLSGDLYQTKYLPIIRETERQTGLRPFLSVIVRTQGRRPEELREALTCLSAQSDSDFEVLLIGHKLNAAETDLVLSIIGEQMPAFKQRIRFLPLNEGTRATPLNYGFAMARGSYTAIFDDDDLLFENWVEKFHEASRTHFGAILHAYVLSQKWMVINTPYGARAPRATSAFEHNHCARFDMLVQVYMNNCPLMGLAFPTSAVQKLGFLFDETLNTTEDWDFFMRTAFCLGVQDIEEPTAIYRIWDNAESSHTLHNDAEWDDNYRRIQEKFLRVPIVLRKGYSQFLCQIIVDRQGTHIGPTRAEYDEVYNAYIGVTTSKSWKITAPLRALLTAYKQMREKLARRKA